MGAKVDGSDPGVVSDFLGNRENVSPLQILSQSRFWLFLRQGSEKLYPGQIQMHRLLRSSGLCGPFGYLKKGTFRADTGRSEINFVSCGFVISAPYSCLMSLCVLSPQVRDISTWPVVGRCWQRWQRNSVIDEEGVMSLLLWWLSTSSCLGWDQLSLRAHSQA